MKELLKYEFRKTWTAKLVVLGIAAVLEIVFLVGLALGPDGEAGVRLIGISAPMLAMTAIFGILFIGIQSVVILHRDMNTRQGYMLYMTPRNSYQILGAKYLENGLSLTLSGAAFFLLGLLDVTALFSRFGQLDQLWEMGKQFMRMLGAEVELNTGVFLSLTVAMLASWLAVVAIAYLADIVSSALLNGKKMNGLISFLFFVILSMLHSWLQNLLISRGMNFTDTMLIETAISLVYSAVMYFLSAYVMDHFLSV